MAERQKPSEHGAIMGAALAKLADSMVAEHPWIPERCKTCAFREGTIPNRSAGTQVQALHCVLGVDDAMFMCHHHIGADGQTGRRPRFAEATRWRCKPRVVRVRLPSFNASFPYLSVNTNRICAITSHNDPDRCCIHFGGGEDDYILVGCSPEEAERLLADAQAST